MSSPRTCRDWQILAILGTILTGTGVLLIVSWFGTRKRMREAGTWERQGGAGAYAWLVIYLVLSCLGIFLALKP